MPPPTPPAAPDPPPDGKPLARLTPRELEILQLVARGMTDREIGLALGVSTRTVESHVAHLMQRLGVHDRAAAVEAFERDRDT
jgi:DNA-binding NarL/FixJ family response regulator